MNIRLIHAILFAAFWVTSVHAGPSVAWKPCELYTKSDAEALFKTPVGDPVEKKTTMPAGQSCRYSFSSKGGTHGIRIRVSSSAEIAEEGIFRSVEDQMDRQKKARQSSETASRLYRAIPGLGDDAFWSGTDLWMRKKDVVIIISVHSVLDGSFANMEAAQSARYEQDLSLSKQVAATILSRMK